MSGPKIQLPSDGISDPGMASFLSSLQGVTWGLSRSGPTAQRPTKAVGLRWVGMMYFDTTIGKPVWLKSVGPDVWVDATGASV